MAQKVYPDWVQAQKTRGTTVKKVGNNYYLYKHSSKRVPGKKYPVPVDTYIGRITPDGVEMSGSKKVATDGADIIVKEYGFSRALELLCPAGWKDPLGGYWQTVLDYIIVRESPESYIPLRRQVPEVLDSHVSYGVQKSSLQRRLRNEHRINIEELFGLKTIYLVRISGKDLISRVSDGQAHLLERLGLELGVC